MSVNVFVFIHESSLPSREEWQAEIDALGIDLQLGEGIEPNEASGYWPVTIRGIAGGFEFYAGSASEVFGAPAPVGAGHRNLAVDLVTHSDMRELECSLLAAAALASVANGVALDEESDGIVTYEALLELAHSIGA